MTKETIEKILAYLATKPWQEADPLIRLIVKEYKEKEAISNADKPNKAKADTK